ncbi:MAG: hypothetical protein IKB44_00495, partial [Clostridia bacterium]|nr:hypothetical protein [Clostridia bacterium]
KSVTVPAGKNVTIDLNGKTISGSSSESTSYAMLTNKGDLTIKDSVGGGKITYVYTGASSNYSFTWGNYTILNSGELTVESGTIENTTNLTGHMFSAIDNHSGGVVTINGGTISCPNYVTIRQFASSATADNTVVINGGTVSGKFALWPQNANGNADTKATLTLNGGIIEGSSKALYIGGPLADTFTITKSASLDLAAPADHKWVEQDGEYVLAACVYVAELNGTKYESLADALTAAQDGDTVTLIWADGDAPIAMNGAVYGKTVTITGTATVDWSKGFLFVGRGGAGNGTVIFENAVLTSASDNASTGIHVSGREKDTNNKYDGTLVINNSTIELDYLINKGDITLDNSTLTVKNGFSIGGRPASETESGVDATATITLNNGSKVVVNKHNGMGLGYEAIGVMNIDATSTFETTQSFLVTAKGTMNIAGKVVIAGTLTNNGQIVLTDAAATLTSSECGNVTTNVADHKVAYANGTYSVVKNENKIISYSLSLEGEIAYRVTYQLNADTLADENAKIVFSFVRDGEPVVVEIPVNNGVSKGDNKYQYSVDLYSFEMMTDITSKLVIGTTEQENCTATASIRDYAEYVLGSETSAEYTDDLKAMLKAMLNYGAYAQTYFGYNAEDLANAGYETDLSVVKATDVTNINAVSGSLDGIAIRGVSLELKARTSLRFVFTVAEGYSIDDYTFKYGDTELEVESLSDGSYRVCVENINVFELDNAYTVDVTMEGNAESTYSVTSSALSYVSIVLNGQYEDGIVNLCKTLYLYNQAGNTYYGR